MRPRKRRNTEKSERKLLDRRQWFDRGHGNLNLDSTVGKYEVKDNEIHE